MSEISNLFKCYDCKKCNLEKPIISEGRKENVFFITTRGDKKYLISNDKDEFSNIIQNKYEIMKHLPKFGKYEIEHYIAVEVLSAMLITGNLTDLLNTSLICEGVRITSERIFEELINCFNVDETYENTIWLSLKM